MQTVLVDVDIAKGADRLAPYSAVRMERAIADAVVARPTVMLKARIESKPDAADHLCVIRITGSEAAFVLMVNIFGTEADKSDPLHTDTSSSFTTRVHSVEDLTAQVQDIARWIHEHYRSGPDPGNKPALAAIDVVIERAEKVRRSYEELLARRAELEELLDTAYVQIAHHDAAIELRDAQIRILERQCIAIGEQANAYRLAVRNDAPPTVVMHEIAGLQLAAEAAGKRAGSFADLVGVGSLIVSSFALGWMVSDAVQPPSVEESDEQAAAERPLDEVVADILTHAQLCVAARPIPSEQGPGTTVDGAPQLTLNEPTPQEIGQLLKELRTMVGWSVQDLANQIPASTSSVYGWESRRHIPSHASLKAIGMVFGQLADSAERSTGKRIRLLLDELPT